MKNLSTLCPGKDFNWAPLALSLDPTYFIKLCLSQFQKWCLLLECYNAGITSTNSFVEHDIHLMPVQGSI